MDWLLYDGDLCLDRVNVISWIKTLKNQRNSHPRNTYIVLFLAIGGVHSKWVFSKIRKTRNQKTSGQSSFFNKFTGRQPATFIKEWLQYSCFPVNSTTFLRTPIFAVTTSETRYLFHARLYRNFRGIIDPVEYLRRRFL